MDTEQLHLMLGEWPGFEVVEVDRRAGQPEEIWITLKLKSSEPLICDECGGSGSAVHDREWRTVRDLPLFDARTFLKVQMPRVWCPRCEGPKRLRISWLDRHQRITRRLSESVGRLCRVLPIRHVADFYGLHWHTVKRIDAAALHAYLAALPPPDVRCLGMDEFALHKGHRYATVVVSLPDKQVLWVGKGRDRRAAARFFKWLGPQRCVQVEAVVMDMNTAYELEVRAHCAAAEVIFDLFHVVAKYGREVIDRVRVDEANRLRGDQTARQNVKSTKWILLKNPDHLSDAQQVQLDTLLAANQALFTVYVLKEDLKQLWDCRDPWHAARSWRGWHQRAMSSGVAPLVAFAKRLKAYLRGILAHSVYPLHTSVLEGINNRIKVIKRMAYGYRDDQYFFLKIRATFPGNAR